MAGVVRHLQSCRRRCCCSPSPPPLLLLLLSLLLPAGPAAAAAGDGDSRCLRLVNSTTEHGHRRSDVRVNSTCGCDVLSLFVMLNASGMPVDCGQNGSWHDTKQTAPVEDGMAAFRTEVAGCFEARCTCANGGHCRKHWRFDGLDYYDYNLEISPEQMPGWPPRLDVHAWPYPRNASQYYFPRLEVRLYRCPAEEHDKSGGDPTACHRVERLVADAAPDVHVILTGSRGSPLTPGRYRLEVLPSDSWVCQGSNNGCKRIQLFKNLSDVPTSSVAVLPSAGGDERMKALYAVVGVTLAVVAAGLVFFWREWYAVRSGANGAPFAVKAPAPGGGSGGSGAQVVLIHLWSGQRLAQIKSELRDAGLQVSDMQDRQMSAVLRSAPVPDILASERLRHAKLVFLCSERALQLERGPAPVCGSGSAGGLGGGGGGGFSSAATSLTGHEAVFSEVLRCVRNSALARDYQRVFVVLPDGDGDGEDAGPVALVPGCRFRWPSDAAELVRQLSLAPATTETECAADQRGVV